MEQKKRIQEIKDRLNWLKTELVHRNYYPGGIIKGFEEEVERLIKELEEIEGK